MARFGIISAMLVELEGFIKEHNAKEISKKGFFKLYECKIGSNDVYLACSGIGKVNAAACTQKLIDCYDIEFIVNMGIAGGIAHYLKTLDVVIGRDVVYHDFSPDSLLDKYFPFTRVYKGDERLIKIAEKICDASSEVKNYFVGCIASGDCFVEKSETKAHIQKLGGLCCEMEGAAIGHVSFINGIPFLIVRSISDLADEGASMSYEDFEQKAALQSNLIVSGILQHFQLR